MKQTINLAFSLVVLVGLWPLMAEFEVPLLYGTVFWGLVFAVVFWVLIRPMVFGSAYV